MSECAAAELVEVCNVQELADAIGGGPADYTAITDALEEVEVGITDQTAALKPTLLNATTPDAYEASRVIKASAGTLYGLTGYSSKATPQFIMLYDGTAVPANGVAPKVVITVPATSNFSIDFGPYGRKFDNGIVIYNSSTAPAKTIGSADCFFDAQYV